MQLNDWIEIAEKEVDTRAARARMAAINNDGEAETEEICWEVKWRILCGYLYELKQRRITEQNMEKRRTDGCDLAKVKKIIEECENLQQSPYENSWTKEHEKQIAYEKIVEALNEDKII